MSLPRVTIADGRLASDPETRTTSDGKPATRLRIVASDRRKNPDTGAWEDTSTCWVTVTCYGEQATHAAASLAKGDLVVVAGRLVTREWTTDAGEAKSTLVILADEVGASLRFRTMPHHHGAQGAPPEQSDATTGFGGSSLDTGGPAF